MLSILYLLSMFIVGYYFMHKFVPWFNFETLDDKVHPEVTIPSWMFKLSFAWVLGSLIINWINFILCDLTRTISSTHITMTLSLAFSVWVIGRDYNKTHNNFYLQSLRKSIINMTWLDYFYSAAALVFAIYITFHTFSENAENLIVSHGVWSDFGPHISMIRSFSVGENFPPQYPHFPAGDMPYHFLFHFMASSLEFLGLPLSWSLNLPSILSLFAMLLMLYVFSVRLTGLKTVGILVLLFFSFRSSLAFFDFVQNYTIWQLPEAISNIDLYIGKTQKEVWGMWTITNYANQRHLPHAITVMLVTLTIMLPLVEKQLFPRIIEEQGFPWRIESIQRPIFLGCFLGAIAFWNGAALIAALLILAGFAITSRHRFEYIIIALIAVIIASMQSRWFISPGKDPIHAEIFFGFLADEKSIKGVVKYILLTYGFLVPLFLLSLIYWKKYALLGMALFFPFLFAFTINPTSDIAINHKFIIISNALIGILVAWMLVDIWINKNRWLRFLVISIIFAMTVTGVVDIMTFHNQNNNKIEYPKNNNIANWIQKNTPHKAIFLTDTSSINLALYAGHPIYLGYTYYGSGAGYDTVTRENAVRLIYGAGTKEDLLNALENRSIDYIVINDPVRNAANYVTNETLINDTFPLAFEDPYEDTKIYKVVR